MIHIFQSNVAVEVGMNAAIILQNLYFWCEKNRANESNYHDGYYWTFNSIKAYEKMFPYLTRNKINTALANLEKDGYIISGNYNASTYDRTKWYAVTEKGYGLVENQKCIYQKSEMDLQKIRNGFAENQKPIPYINTDINTDNISLDSKESNCQTNSKSDVKKCVEAWNALSKYGIKPISKLQSTSQRYQMLSARLNEYGIEDVLKAIDKIKGSSFLQGRTKVGAQWFDFEWFVRPNNFPKVLEGKYDDAEESNESIASSEEDRNWQ